MRDRVRTVALCVGVAMCVSAQNARADSHAVICQSAAEAKNFVRLVDEAPKPTRIGDVLLTMRSKAMKCTVVFADVQISEIVETLQLAADDYEIVRVRVNNRQYYSFKRPKGDRA